MSTSSANAVDESFIGHLTTRLSDAATTWRSDARVGGVRPLTGGTSSLTFLADLTSASFDEQIVVKVSPPGLEPVRNRDVLRQAEVMAALQSTPEVLVPTVLFSQAGSDLDNPPFVAMEFVSGVCTEPLLEEAPRITGPAETYDRFLDAARMLGHLHRADPAAIGLGSHPQLTIDDEIARWVRAFDTVPDDLRGNYVEGARALRAAMPAAAPPAVTHGDYRLGNTLCTGSSVTSIIDWEIWAVGDPRTDLTWLTYFADEADHPAAPPLGPCGSPTVATIVEAYEDAYGRPVLDLDYFHMLTRYKEAAATALLIKRARRTGNMPESFQRMEPRIVSMVDDVIDALREA